MSGNNDAVRISGLEIRPAETIIFTEPKESNEFYESCSEVHLENVTKNAIIFKVKTTAPQMYRVKPNLGVISPSSKVTISITFFKNTEAASSTQKRNDKFLIMAAILPLDSDDWQIPEDIKLNDLWSAIDKNDQFSHKLKAHFETESAPTRTEGSFTEITDSLDANVSEHFRAGDMGHDCHQTETRSIEKPGDEKEIGDFKASPTEQTRSGLDTSNATIRKLIISNIITAILALLFLCTMIYDWTIAPKTCSQSYDDIWGFNRYFSAIGGR